MEAAITFFKKIVCIVNSLTGIYIGSKLKAKRHWRCFIKYFHIYRTDWSKFHNGDPSNMMLLAPLY